MITRHLQEHLLTRREDCGLWSDIKWTLATLWAAAW